MKPLLSVVLACLAFPAMQSLAQTLTLDHDTYSPGDTIEVTFTGTPGNGLDWIGIYPEEIIPSGNPPSTIWRYTSNTNTPGDGVVDGTVVFENITLAPGNWRAYFLLNDGYELLTEGVPFVVVAPPGLTVEDVELRPGEPLIINVAGRPSEPADRVALFRAADNPLTAEPAIWAYLDGTRTLPAAGLAGAMLEFDTSGLTDGDWALHFQAGNLEDIVLPVAIAVRRAAVIESFTVFPAYLDGPGTVTLEWFIDDGGIPLEKVEIRHGTTTLDVTGNGQPLQDVELAASTNLLLVVNDTATALTTVYMPTSPSPSFMTDKTEYQLDEPITISWSGAAGGPVDWVGIYTLGDQPGPIPSRQWVYTRNAQTGDGTAGSFTFNIPQQPNLEGPLVPLPEGDYFAALMLDDGYAIEFGVIPFRVIAEIPPVDAPFTLTIAAASPDSVTLEWESLAGRTYTVESSPNLQQWSPLAGATGLPGQAGHTSHVVTRPADPGRYYRVRLNPAGL